VDVVFLDFAKAFDKVPKERLLQKLKAHGVQGNILRWIRNWLTGRRQRVVLNGKCSDWTDVLSGVPQGSVLGPILFLIFINDLDAASSVIRVMKKFADDTKLGHTVSSDVERGELQEALDKLFRWDAIQRQEVQGHACEPQQPEIPVHDGRRDA
jgi:ribonuclease P/MRP protein subunit RPP40